MKINVLLALVALSIISSQNLSFAAVSKEESYDAAYSGDLDFLQDTFSEAKNGKASLPISPSDLVGEALAGHQLEVVKWCANQDPDANKLCDGSQANKWT